jgi:hypothetical protein
VAAFMSATVDKVTPVYLAKDQHGVDPYRSDICLIGRDGYVGQMNSQTTLAKVCLMYLVLWAAIRKSSFVDVCCCFH